MADLTDLQSAETVKIAGANPSSGIESNFANVDSNGNLQVLDYADGAVGSAVPPVINYIGGKDPSGNLQPLPIDENDNLITTDALRDHNADSAVFVSQTPSINVGTSETPFLLFVNPNASGKTLKIFRMKFQATGTFRLYFTPTVTANGTTVAPQLKKITGGVQGNVGLTTTSPTTTSHGTLIDIFIVSAQTGVIVNDEPSFVILPENTELLITAQMGANNTPTQCHIEWVEV